MGLGLGLELGALGQRASGAVAAHARTLAVERSERAHALRLRLGLG